METSSPSLPFPNETLERLAKLIVEGDVVFFAGAGFSIDVENNTAVRLIRRLLIRLYALTSPGVYPKPERKDVRAIFAHTFLPGGGVTAANFPYDEVSKAERARKKVAAWQPPTETPFPFDEMSLKRLASRYYEVNDWFVNTFGYLLRNVKLVPETDSPEDVAAALMDMEATIQQSIPGEPVALEPIDPDLIAWAQQAPDYRRPGKALFLDTLGFRNREIMRGRLLGPPPKREEELLDSVERLFFGALLPRHRVIARFAREGWCPTTITTNYDMLLEGAYRLAGFATEKERDEFPRTRFNKFARIASPVEFFTDGKALREPVLLKMHGCAERYRSWNYKEVGENAVRREEFKAYLKSMVFTYREIQNWRQDSWAADFLRTQLRTRTVVFSGYSLQDPVIHDTFRTVYEEMGRIRQNYEAPAPPENANGLRDSTAPDEGEAAPAFFFAPGDQYEFYGLEVLRAASAAVGVRRMDPKTHPNYLRFHFRGGNFPDLDEQFMWLYHRAVRIQQTENLRNHLRRISSLWLKKPRPEEDLCAIEGAFSAIDKEEQAAAERWSQGDLGSARREFQRITAWTDIFLSGLLREFACGDLVQRHRGPGNRLARLRRTAWYFPIMENPHWCGWAAVVEIALRRMAAVLNGTPDNFSGTGTGPETAIVAQCDRPTLLFATPNKRTRHAVTIHYSGFGLTSRQAPLSGAVGGRTFWELRPSDARWYPTGARDPLKAPQPRQLGLGSWSLPVPASGFIWRWATGKQNDTGGFCDTASAKAWIFGGAK